MYEMSDFGAEMWLQMIQAGAHLAAAAVHGAEEQTGKVSTHRLYRFVSAQY